MAVIDFNTGDRDSGNIMDRITKQYRLEHDKLDSSMRMKNFENEIAERIATKLQEENKKAIKAGKAISSTTTTAFDTDEQTKFYKAELGDLITNVNGMTRDQLEVQKNRMNVLMKTLEDSNAKEKDFLMKQYEQSQEFLQSEYDRRNSLKERGGDLLKEARDTFLNFESASMALIGNNPLGAMVVQMGANYFKRQDKKKKDEKTLIERDLHRQHMATKTEEDKIKTTNAEKKRKEELDELSYKYELEKQKEEDLKPKKAVSGYDSLIGKSVDESSRAEEIIGGQEEKKDRKLEQSYYNETLQWQKSITKILTSGEVGLGVGTGTGTGIAGAGVAGGGKGMVETAIGGAVAGGIASKFEKVKDVAKNIAKNKTVRRAVLLTGAIGGFLGLSGGKEAEASGITKDAESQKRIQSKVDEEQTNAMVADVGLSSVAPMLGKGLSKFIPGLGAIGDVGYEYAEGGSAGSSMVSGGGAIGGAMLGATIGSVVPVIGTVLGGLLGGIAGSMGASSIFGDSDEEKQHNLISRDLQDRGYINRDDLLPYDDSELLKTDLQDLSLGELKALLAIDDFNEADTKIIQENLKIKQANKAKISKESQSLLAGNGRNNGKSLTGAGGSILEQIGQAESGGDYDAEWGGGKFGKRGKKLTDMTMGEVKAYQKEMLNTQKGMGKGAGQRSSALGKFQFVSSSMKEAQSMSGLSDDDLYSQENQDKMGEMWLRKRGGMDAFLQSDKTSKDADMFQNKVAGQWASMKTTEGVGKYDLDGMNTARHSIRANIDSLSAVDSSLSKIVEKIETINQDIKSTQQAKSDAPIVMTNSVSNNSSGGGQQESVSVGSARNNESSLQRITDRYISTGMS